jgi:hypothetical protein
MQLSPAPSRSAPSRASRARHPHPGTSTGLLPARRSAAPAITLAAAALLPLLAGCETTAPPPEPAAASSPPRLQPPPAPRVVDARWSFRADEASCVASAAHSALALTIAVRDRRSVEVALRPGAATQAPPARRRGGPSLAFSGPTGSWRASGRAGPARAVVLAQPLDETTASVVLMMLDGGSVDAGGPATGLPALRLPPGGPAGRGWFECVRRQLPS